MNKHLSLKAFIRKLPNSTIELLYTAHNTSDNKILLFTPLTELSPDGSYVPDETIIYRWKDGDGTVHFSKQLIEVPDDVDVYMPIIPFLTPLSRGEKFSEKLIIDCPFTSHHPYTTTNESEIIDLPFDARFSLGYAFHSSKLQTESIDIEGHPYIYLNYSEAISNQYIETVTCNEE